MLYNFLLAFRISKLFFRSEDSSSKLHMLFLRAPKRLNLKWINYDFFLVLFLDSVSSEINKLVKLESLSFASNSLKTINLSNASKMKHLKSVNLSSNKLTTFPVDFCNLTNLDALDLSCNSIVSLPADIKTLKAIELNLNRNKLKELNDGLCFCERLKVLRVEENCLDLHSMTEGILKRSQVSLISFDGNTFSMKEFQELEGYEEVRSRVYYHRVPLFPKK